MNKSIFFISILLCFVTSCQPKISERHIQPQVATISIPTLTLKTNATPASTPVSIMELPGSPEEISKVCQVEEYTDFYCPSLRGASQDGVWSFFYCMEIYDCEKPSHYVMYNNENIEKSWVVSNKEISQFAENNPFGWHVVAWSENNQSAYMTYEKFCEFYPGCGYTDAQLMYELNMSSRQLEEIIPQNRDLSINYALAISPNSQLLAYIISGTQELVIRDLELNEEIKIKLDDSQLIYGDISWSPDSDRLVIRSSLREQIYNFSLWIFNISDQTTSQILSSEDRDFFPVKWIDNDTISLHESGAAANKPYKYIYKISTQELLPDPTLNSDQN